MSGTTVGGIAVPIFAVDNATAVINRVTKNIANMVAPTQRVGQGISRATTGNVAGMNTLSLGMSNLGNATFETVRGLDLLVPALGIITGALTLAGMGKLVQRFSDLGQRTGNVGLRLGIATDSLTGLQGAAQLAGVSTADMTSGLGALDEKLRGAVFRGDGQAIQTFNAIGVGFGEIGKRARSADDAIYDVADGIKRLYDTQGRGAALRAAQNLGLEGLFPLLLKGGAGMRALEADAARLGGVLPPEMVARAEALHNAFARVDTAVGGFANRLVDSLTPALTPVLNAMAEWIADNGKWIAQDLAGWVEKLAVEVKRIDWTEAKKEASEFMGYLKQLKDFTLEKVIPGIEDFVKTHGLDFNTADPANYTGGTDDFDKQGIMPTGGGAPWDWLMSHLRPDKGAAGTWWERLMTPSPLFAPGGGYRAPITVPQAPSAQAGTMGRVHDFFAAKGLSEDNIAGILANVAAESGFDATRWGDNHTSYGLFQTHADRLSAMQRRYGHLQPTEQEQLEFAWSEPQMQRALAAMQGRTAAESGAKFSDVFESPAGKEMENLRRGAAAQGFVDVHVSIDGPAGTVAKGKAGGIATMGAPPRISTALPIFGPDALFAN